MIPVVFNDCMGVLHPAREGTACGRAVVICESFGYEALCTHRAMLTLARMMADAGMPTLRFNYPETGNSAGDETPGQIDRWIDSIGAAARYLQEISGATEVTLCGFRFGGLLAIKAAERFGGVAALALLAPVLSGRAYTRELILSGAMIPGREGSLPPDWREILGYRLHASDLDTLRAMDLRDAIGAGTAPRILLVSPDAEPQDLDPSITFRHFQHYDGLTQHVQDIVMPMRVFGETVKWLRLDAPRRPARLGVTPAAARLEVLPNLVETPVLFGENDRCFGVLTRHLEHRHDCAVLILNSGLNHQTGNGRGGVRLARRLAGAGVTTLRMDMGKIGESAPRNPMQTVGFHDLGRVKDVIAALDVLQQTGHSRVLLTGICAGAYVALHAVAAADARVHAAVLVNLPYFYIRDEDPAIPLWRRPLSMIRRLNDWTRAWRSRLGRDTQPMLGPRYFRRHYLAGRALLLLHYATLSVSQRVRAFLGGFLPKPWVMGRADRLLQRICQLGIGLTLVYSGEDWGLIELNILFSAHGKRLIQNDWASIRIIDGADHTITTGWMQDAYASVIEEQLGLNPRTQAEAQFAEPLQTITAPGMATRP